MSTETPKLSPVEAIKEQSGFLKGEIGQELQEATDTFGKESGQLLKFHGTYQQDDRDLRKSPGGKVFSFMVRNRIPGGQLSSAQLLAELDLCDELGDTTIRLTTRQSIQLHGVIKSNLRAVIHRINEVQLSTLAACGDVNRNVMCCPAKLPGRARQQMQEMAHTLAMHLAPQTPAYHELWVTDPETDEKTLAGGGHHGHVVEPIYGPTYLPRKFKIGIGLPDDNCVDLYTQDIGLLAVVRNDHVIGYNVLVGGSFGTTPSAAKTFPALAKRMAFASSDQVVDVCTAIVKVQRDHGNREDRKRARFKYLVHDWGVERVRETVEKYYGRPLEDCTEDEVHGFDDHVGWQEQGDGLASYGLNIENGRIYDNERVQLKAALRAICTELAPPLRLTPHQSLLFTDIAPENRGRLEEILQSHGVRLSEQTSTVRRWSMACVALPTCGLAVTESERVLPGYIDQLEAPLAKLGLSREAFTIRMTGCPNGCARPYNADIGLVGKTKGKYTMFVGGALIGTRLNYLYKDLVPAEELVGEMIAVFAAFKTHRQGEESLGDFCHRVGRDALERLAAEAPKP